MIPKFHKNMTYGEAYGPAMKITDPEEAQQYFKLLVRHHMTVWGNFEEEAITIEKQNLGYYAGYYSHETRLRVEKLFGCVHPVFGAATKGEPTVEEALQKGQELAKKK